MKHRRSGSVLIIILLGIVSCAGPQPSGPSGDSPKTIAYKALASAAQSYDNGMQVMADMYANRTTDAKGNLIVTDVVKAKVIEYGKVFKQSYDRAVDAAEAGDYDVSAMSKALADFLSYIRPYLVRGGKG